MKKRLSSEGILLSLSLCIYLGCDGMSELKGNWFGKPRSPAQAGNYLALDLKTGAVDKLGAASGGGWALSDKTDRLVLRAVRPGSFVMGAAGDPKSLIQDESPAHRVSLTRGYYIGVFEVTKGQWARVLGETPECRAGDAAPADRVSRADCERFLSALRHRFPDYDFTLPTEAEWEFASRAGAPYDGRLADPAETWFLNNAEGRTHAVGMRHPNGWGLYDMCGNVWEWCRDAARAYPSGEAADPVALAEPGTSPLFIARGGSWRNAAGVCTSVRRGSFAEDIECIPIGFRVACRPLAADAALSNAADADQEE